MAGIALQRYAWLSVAAALATIALKALAYALTGSVGLLSDALESLVNLAGAGVAVVMLSIAARPPDEDHPYGHDKAEYFASGFEGMLILVAALAIGWTALGRLLAPQPLQSLGLGVLLSGAASAINFAVARVLLTAGRRYRSIALEADAHHLMTDVWTSAGVIVGVGLAQWSGRLWLDPLVALAVAAHIVWTGVRLLRRSVAGLMDAQLPPEEQRAVLAVLERLRAEGLQYHALRTRRAGARAFVSVHLLVPGAWTVQHAHELAERVEAQIRAALPGATVITHLEPLEDPASWHDAALDRDPPTTPPASWR